MAVAHIKSQAAFASSGTSATFSFAASNLPDFCTFFLTISGSAILSTDTLTLTSPSWTLTKTITDFGLGGASSGVSCCFTAWIPDLTSDTFTVGTTQNRTITFLSWLVDEWSGVDSNNPIDNKATAITNGTQTVNITPVKDNCAVVGGAFDTISAAGTIGGIAANVGCNDSSGDMSTYRILTGGAGTLLAVNPSGVGNGLLMAVTLLPTQAPVNVGSFAFESPLNRDIVRVASYQ